MLGSLELVGLHAHGSDKIGRDAAEIAGFSEPVGIVATNDVDALLAAAAVELNLGQAPPAQAYAGEALQIAQDVGERHDPGGTAGGIRSAACP